MENIRRLLSNPARIARVNAAWESISEAFQVAESAMPVKYMPRREISFNDNIRLLGYLCVDVAPLPGDIVEIGVWKGKSLALMQRLTQAPTKVIGIDPCEVEGQRNELAYFHSTLFSASTVIIDYSQHAIEGVLNLSRHFKLLHIDGAHMSRNVWMDFLIYERFVIPGGYIVFDDYMDHTHCPEVGPTVDRMRDIGLFRNYEDIGPVPGFENSYLLLKTAM